MRSITWTGKSGKKYEYTIHELDADFSEVAGNYIFAQETKPGYWRAVYVGQTSNLSERLENHEQEDCAKKKGATAIHAHANASGERARKAEEEDLIAGLNPHCNEQLVQKQ